MSEVMTDDAGDLALARRGGEAGAAAFARVYDRHAPVVLSVCRSALPDGAEDACQEVFIRAYRRLAQVQSPEKLRPWLYGIARRVCAERRRAAARRAIHEERAMIARSEPMSETSRERAEHAEDLARLGEVLRQLPENERLAIHLYYLDADPVRAAAEAIGISRSGFYKLLARARRRLAERLLGATTP